MMRSYPVHRQMLPTNASRNPSRVGSSARLFMADAATVRADDVEAAFARLEKEAFDRLSHEGIAPADVVLQRSVELMYQGQWRSLLVAAPSPVTSVESLVDSFHREHEREYNFRRGDAPVSLFRVGLKAVGLVPKAELSVHAPDPRRQVPFSRRQVWFEAKPCDTPIYRRDDLPAGFGLTGPAIVEQFDSTVVVPPGMTASVDKYLNIIIAVKAQ